MSELARNLESACSQLREMGLYTDNVYFYVKSIRAEFSRFKNLGENINLKYFTNSELSIFKFIERLFDKFEKLDSRLYRSSGIVLSNLHLKEDIQFDLFNSQENAIQEENKITKTIDDIRKKFGYRLIQTGISLSSNIDRTEQSNKRAVKDDYEYGLPYPFLGIIHN